MSSRRKSGANLRQASSPYAGHAVAARATAKEAAYYTKMARHYSNLAVKAAGQARAYAGNYGAYAGQAMGGSPYSGQAPCNSVDGLTPGPGQTYMYRGDSAGGCRDMSPAEVCRERNPNYVDGSYKDGKLLCTNVQDNTARQSQALLDGRTAQEAAWRARSAEWRRNEQTYMDDEGRPVTVAPLSARRSMFSGKAANYWG